MAPRKTANYSSFCSKIALAWLISAPASTSPVFKTCFSMRKSCIIISALLVMLTMLENMEWRVKKSHVSDHESAWRVELSRRDWSGQWLAELSHLQFPCMNRWLTTLGTHTLDDGLCFIDWWPKMSFFVCSIWEVFLHYGNFKPHVFLSLNLSEMNF